MAQILNHRRGPERRKQPRGGRRTEDATGFAPLVLLVGEGDEVVAQSEVVLAKLRFAVATSATVEEALRVLMGIRPDVVVAEPEAASRIRLEAPEHLPVVVLTDEMHADRNKLIEGIRESIRMAKRPAD
jgi:hypothetical protein